MKTINELEAELLDVRKRLEKAENILLWIQNEADCSKPGFYCAACSAKEMRNIIHPSEPKLVTSFKATLSPTKTEEE